MKFHPFHLLLLVATGLTFSCGGDINPIGTYRGKIVMEDGSNVVTLKLGANNKAEVRGLLPKTAHGTWEPEATGMGFVKDGVVAAFDVNKPSDESFRVVLMLQPHEEGLTLADIRVRLLIDGKFSMLQSFTLKEKKPLLRRLGEERK